MADNKATYIDGLAWNFYAAMEGDLPAWSDAMDDVDEFGRSFFRRHAEKAIWNWSAKSP